MGSLSEQCISGRLTDMFSDHAFMNKNSRACSTIAGLGVNFPAPILYIPRTEPQLIRVGVTCTSVQGQIRSRVDSAETKACLPLPQSHLISHIAPLARRNTLVVLSAEQLGAA